MSEQEFKSPNFAYSVVDSTENFNKFEYIGIEKYFSDFYFVNSFILKNFHNENERFQDMSRNLARSTLKCMVVGNVLFLGYRFSQGRQHYLRYLKSMIQGAIFGIGYSVYFNNEKLMQFTAKEMAIQEYLTEKRREMVDKKK